ncbi:early activation antigen CD69-like [Sphaeramia orbicularis]|uniref:early activation antigen CD69-like n=1 Tax=Sphaeramia orbicularis TaxID=375764 RepID=UPI00117D2B5B|nr:early activation antigen CD69-like [Sphaeramia orbicularis]
MSYLVILLLVSGRMSLCSLIHREYYLIPLAKSWNDAQVYCRENYFDLAVIGDREDLKRLSNTAAAAGVNGQLWIGLKKDGAAVWLWSVGDTQSGHGLVNEYTNWASSPESSHHCGGMRHDGKWLSALCQSELPFVCQGCE